MNKSLKARAARAMRRAFEGSKSGALVSVAGDVKRLVFFESGELVGARSTLGSERLPYVLLRRGVVTEEQLNEANKFIRSGRKLAELLVELGHVDADALEKIERSRVVDIACGILMASSTRLAFSDKVELDRLTAHSISIGDVFLEAVRRLDNVDGIRERVLLKDYVPVQTPDAFGIAASMKLSDAQAEVFDLVDGRHTLGDIFESSPLPDDDTVRIVIALHQAGGLALDEPKPVPETTPDLDLELMEDDAPPPPSAPDPFEKELTELYNNMQCQNHWQILGLSRGASHAAIERAYKELRLRIDPDDEPRTGDVSVEEKLSFVRARAKDAYVTLSSQSAADVYEKLDEHDPQYQESRDDWDKIDPSPPAASPDVEPGPNETAELEIDAIKDPEEAARLFATARQAFQEKDYWRTIELCRMSIELDEDNQAERYHLLGCSLAENPKWRRDAERNLQIAKDLEPWEPRYLVSLGQLYEKEGLLQRAERTYQQVRTIDPEFAIPKFRPDELHRRRRKAG